MSNRVVGPSLLIVEDSDEDFEATVRSLKKIGSTLAIIRCVDGDDALDFLYQRGAYQQQSQHRPSLILLDLNMPATDGREVLLEIKQNNKLKSIPVLVLTTSSNPKDIEACYQGGANSYLIKPVNIQEFTHMLRALHDYWLHVVALPEAA